jgi:phage baseplate assembly protein W
MEMTKPFLGVGWAYPIKARDDGALQMAEYEESVRQAIWIILGTAKGERVMRPGFGCGIYDLVFEVNSPSTAGRVAQEVKDALLMFEPRIDVLDVQTQPGGHREVLFISIDYQVRATDNSFNLVYPFYLERSAG